MKYMDVEEMRAVTNDKHIAEQIKSDSTLSARECLLNRKVESTVMNGPSVGKFGKVENYENDDETMSQGEERLCKSIIRGLVKRDHEKRAMLAGAGENKEQDVTCFDDITGKDLPWHAVREARELELKYLRDLGVYENAGEKGAVEKYGTTPVDTKWVDTDKAFEENQGKSDHECVRESSEAMIGQICMQRTPLLESLKAIISIAANHKETFSIMHIDVSRAYFHAKAQRLVLIRLPVEDRMGTDAGKVGLMKKSMYRTRDAASNWERDWQEPVRNWGLQLGRSFEESVSPQGNRVSCLAHGDDSVLTGPTKKLMEFEMEMTSVCHTNAKIMSYGSASTSRTPPVAVHLLLVVAISLSSEYPTKCGVPWEKLLQCGQTYDKVTPPIPSMVR